MSNCKSNPRNPLKMINCDKANKILGIERMSIKKKIYSENIKKCPECRGDISFEKRRNKFCSQSCAAIYKNKNKITLGKVYAKYYKIKTSNGMIKVHGTYEVRACFILDKMKENKEIYNWKYSPDKIKYIHYDNKQRSYIPDFKIFKNKKDFYYLEIKGWVKDLDYLKWESAEKQGYEIIVWLEKDIIEREFKIAGGR